MYLLQLGKYNNNNIIINMYLLQWGKYIIIICIYCNWVYTYYYYYYYYYVNRQSVGSNAGRVERFSSTRPDLLPPPILLFNGYRGLFVGVKRPEQVANHLSAYRTGFKNKWRYTSTRAVCLRDVYRGSFNVPCMISRRYLYVGNDIGIGEYYITRIVIICTPPNSIQHVDVGVSP